MGGLWERRVGLAHSQSENGPQSYHHRKLDSTNDLGEFGRGLSPEPPDRAQLMSYIWPWETRGEKSVEPTWIGDMQNWELIDGCCFKLGFRQFVMWPQELTQHITWHSHRVRQ